MSNQKATVTVYNREEKEARDYWISKLSSEIGASNIILDYKRPRVLSGERGCISEMINGELLDRLDKLTSGSAFLLYTALLAGLKAYLHKYTRNALVVVGSPACKNEDGLWQPANVLPIIAEIDGRISFRQLLLNVREILLEAYTNQSYPFQNLARDLGLDEIENRCPLFDIALVLTNIHVPMPDLKNDITIKFTREESQISCRVEFTKEIFTPQSIRLFLDYYTKFLNRALEDTTKTVGEVSVISESERQQLLVEHNASQKTYPHNSCIHHLFETQVRLKPDAIALALQEEQITYKELDRRANRLARFLQSKGVGPEVIVAIYMERSIQTIAALFGVLKSGGAFLPIDPAYPKNRIAFMLEDAQVSVSLTQQHLLESLPETALCVINLDSEFERVPAEDELHPSIEAAPDNAAYIIYTSGSTGQPKGVLIEHRGVCNLVQAQASEFEVHPGSRVLQFASLSFDASVSEVFVTLCGGATLVLASQDTLLPGTGLIRLLQEQSISIVTLPPSVLMVLPDETLPALRTLVVAGEACTSEVVARWAKGRRFLNAYGPTEATVCATIERCEYDGRRPAIGRPIDNVQIYLLDSKLEPVPIGMLGEIYIGSVGLARGYVRRPDLTVDKFGANPFSSVAGARLYKTGDLGRFRPSGSIEFLGRIDGQLKVRGYRIEPEEIEMALAQCSAVKQSVVVAQESDQGGSRLVAYVVASDGLRSRGNGSRAKSLVEEGAELELWPSVAEYFVYDEVLYYAMTNDERRNRSYKAAINRAVKDKVVVEIGTGPDAILARFCIEAGAKKVYAIEILDESYDRAVRCVRSLGLEEKIILIHGDATELELPEKADVCVSEIIGAIGGSEGAAGIINNAWRFLKEGGMMIPERSVTKIAAVSLPDKILERPALTELTKRYTEKIFEQVGYKFDLRLCVKGVNHSYLISDTQVFEDLDFTRQIKLTFCNDVSFSITKDSRIDGFLVWLTLHTAHDEVIDILEHEHCWLPVYLPVFYPGLEVSRGDEITAIISGTPCQNNLNPDYKIQGRLTRRRGEAIDFEYNSYHYKQSYRQTPFYDALFAGDSINVQKQDFAELIRKHLKKYLPDYMVPSAIVVLDAMPLTQSGKIDKKALPAPNQLTRSKDDKFALARSPVEEVVAGIWCEVLEVNSVGLEENFFEMGGHSLLATQVISRVRKMLEVEIEVKSLFERPTVRGLSEFIESKMIKGSRPPAPPIVPVKRIGALPLSFGQKRLWVFDQIEPGNPVYNIPSVIRLIGPLSVPALQQTLTEVARRHEILRTIILIIDGEPMQQVLPPTPIRMWVVDLSRMPDEMRLLEAKRIVKLEASGSFDLGRGPLIRAGLVKLEEKDHVAVMTMHHIVSDGWSTGILIAEVREIYRAIVRGEEARLKELAIQYGDYAVWQREQLEGEVIEEQKRYWKEQLRGAPEVMNVVGGRERPEVQSYRGGSEAVRVSKEVSEGIREMSRREGVTLYMSLLGAFKVLLTRYSGEEDIVVGTSVAGRSRVETEGLIGFFVNTLVMRTDLGGDPSFRQLLNRVKEVVLEAYAHQDLPFEKLVEELHPERSLSHMPLYQVLFVLQNIPHEELDLEGIQIRPFIYEKGVSRVDLMLSLTESGDRLSGAMEYNSDLFEAKTIRKMIRHYCNLLEAVIADPDMPISQISMLDESETGGYTHRDFPHSGMNQEEFENLLMDL